jgi:hypothetical protein
LLAPLPVKINGSAIHLARRFNADVGQEPLFYARRAKTEGTQVIPFQKASPGQSPQATVATMKAVPTMKKPQLFPRPGFENPSKSILR